MLPVSVDVANFLIHLISLEWKIRKRDHEVEDKLSLARSKISLSTMLQRLESACRSCLIDDLETLRREASFSVVLQGHRCQLLQLVCKSSSEFCVHVEQ